MSRVRLLSSVAVVVVLAGLSTGAQSTDNTGVQRATLTAIIRHEWVRSPAEIAGAIDAALRDRDATIRELALAAVVSRAGGPGIAQTAVGATDWVVDRGEIQKLRRRVLDALEDPEERVRVQAIAAVASLDFDFNALEVRLSRATEQRLLRRFYADSSPRVRAKIVSGFGTDARPAGEDVKRLLLDAFDDVAPAVRHAAGAGFEKLDMDRVLPRVLNQLSDSNRNVRAQAAVMLGKARGLTAEQTTALDAAIANEADGEVRQLMRRAKEASAR